MPDEEKADTQKEFDRELAAWMSEFQRVGDHAMILLGASRLDADLERILRAKFVDVRKTADRLLRPDGPLGSFSAKIDCCQAVGLLSLQAARELHQIRRIRNEAAHAARFVSVSVAPLADMCSSLRTWIPDAFPDNSRSRFILAVCGINLRLLGISARIRKCRQPVPTTLEMGLMTDEEREKLLSCLHDGKLALDPKVYDIG